LLVDDFSFKPASSAGLASDVLAAGALSLDEEPPDLAAGFDSRASFFAQPLPLNTMAGVESSLRIGPPHSSQAVGPLSWTPWITSTLWPQLRHS
jgi:hypothetical protein